MGFSERPTAILTQLKRGLHHHVEAAVDWCSLVFPFILPYCCFSSSRNLFILGHFNSHYPYWHSTGTSDPCAGEVFDWVISSDLLSLNVPKIFTLPTSPLLPLLLLTRDLELVSDHLPILTNCLSLCSFAPTNIPLQCLESSLEWLCFLVRLSLSFCREILFSISFLCCCSLYFFGTECGQIIHSFRSRQTPTSSLVVC